MEEAERFRSYGRGQFRDFLTPTSAEAMHTLVTEYKSWNAVFNRQGTHTDLDAKGLQSLSGDQMRAFLGYLNQSAGREFQYYFANVPLYDIYHANKAHPNLRNLYEFLNGEEFLTACRRLTGYDDIAFADAQMTRYGPGQFLTRHDDNIEGKNRLAAYVLNLTTDWRVEWGGLLQFHDETGKVTEAYEPGFNILNIFKVPQSHSVSYVTPFTRAYRYSITGWLRSGVDPKGE